MQVALFRVWLPAVFAGVTPFLAGASSVEENGCGMKRGGTSVVLIIHMSHVSAGRRQLTDGCGDVVSAVRGKTCSDCDQ